MTRIKRISADSEGIIADVRRGPHSFPGSQALLGNPSPRSSASRCPSAGSRAWAQVREAELRDVRAQAELGHEANLRHDLVHLPVASQPVEISPFRPLRDFLEELHRPGFVAGFARIICRNHQLDFYRDNVAVGPNQPRPLDALSLKLHGSPRIRRIQFVSYLPSAKNASASARLIGAAFQGSPHRSPKLV